ncbi:DUF2637 domain-containing protein (plasmid) [Streptomyces sp. NBC_01281]|uniref:DUF2637 domain-containing protein n=1 Tax=Streptomyces sp. NBC_01281 TaxID=2903811 RepID=UPI002E14BAD6|nr:DUF2637 domain-containing protein [Streptomyces sp. NBC_01281]
MPTTGTRIQLTPLQRRLIIAVAIGSAVIAAIGFVGSYAAVRNLAEAKGFGRFALAFPIGVDAGILVLLAVDLLLTWLRMPLPMLRHTAWFLTGATILFNAAAAWPDPVGTGMHAVIPVLFVVMVEAARHATGRAADLTAGRHMDSVRLARWILAPVSTFFLWRRMKVWELRSYDQVIALELQRKIERARLHARYGRKWRDKAPVEAVLALDLTRYGREMGSPIQGVLDIEHPPAGAPQLATATQRVAIEASTFDAVAKEAIAVVRAQPSAALPPAPKPQPTAQPTPQPTAQPTPQPTTQPTPQPTAQPTPQPTTQPTPQPRPRTRPKGGGRPKGRRFTPEEMTQLRLDALPINEKALRETNKKASQRTLQNALGIGQRTAQAIQNQLPDTLAAALATDPNTKEA